MDSSKLRTRFEALMALAGIKVGGNAPWDIRVYHDGFFARVLSQASLGLGESYVDRWWDCAKLDEFFCRILKARLDRSLKSWGWLFNAVKTRLLNPQRQSRAFQIGRHHYDIGNDLYACMLDSRMIYSCGYWEDASTLEQAQAHKLDLICRKLQLKPGMRLLDIGCGWGGTAKFAAERHDVEVVGITVSQAQAEFAREVCAGLPVEIRLQDYRDLEGSFDRIVSIGMFEHVGFKNYATFMRVARRCLKDDGLVLLHTIGGNRSVTRCDPWIERYIFPNAMLPSVTQIGAAMEGQFVLEDWQSLGAHYDKTLLHWFRRFDAHWPRLRDRYDERFYRMWKYYLLSCAGSFRARVNQVWQLVLSPQGVVGGYRPAWRAPSSPARALRTVRSQGMSPAH